MHGAVIRKVPKGTVLVLGAWNYPVAVQIGPMVGAIAAGNTVIMKVGVLVIGLRILRCGWEERGREELCLLIPSLPTLFSLLSSKLSLLILIPFFFSNSQPSEVSPNSAKLIQELFAKYMDPDAYTIVNGGVPEATALLDQRWEHIMYTGNGTVGRIVAEKAAKWLWWVTPSLPFWEDDQSTDDCFSAFFTLPAVPSV